MKLDERVAAFDLLDIPIWIYDSERTTILWANREAVALWRAESLEALQRRDFSQTSESVRARWRVIGVKLAEGQTAHEQFTFYPGGVAVSMDLFISAIQLDDGKIAQLVRAQLDRAVDPALVRGIEAVRHTSAVIAMLDEEGAILMQNPASIRAFGEQTAFFSWLEGAEVGAAILATAKAGQVFSDELPVRTRQGERWYAIEARGTRDPATGAAAVLVQMLDTTVQREMASTLERQRRRIRGLSVPILSLGAKTLAVPLIGTMDQERGALLAEQLLPAIVATGARTVILDLTGLEEFEAEDVAHLVRVVRAVELLGASPILTGIRPELAHKMVSMQVQLGGVRVLRDLREVLREASRLPARLPQRG
jgi:rsbT co-antagonist protein RsbR